MDRGAWWAAVHWVAKGQIWLNNNSNTCIDCKRRVPRWHCTLTHVVLSFLLSILKEGESAGCHSFSLETSLNLHLSLGYYYKSCFCRTGNWGTQASRFQSSSLSRTEQISKPDFLLQVWVISFTAGISMPWNRSPCRYLRATLACLPFPAWDGAQNLRILTTLFLHLPSHSSLVFYLRDSF